MEKSIDHIIIKHLKGELNLEEQHQLLQWKNRDQANADYLRSFEYYWYQTLKSKTDLTQTKQDVWHQVGARMNHSNHHSISILDLIWKYSRIAAVFLLIGFVGVYILSETSSNDKPGRYIERISLAGQKVKIKLPDGSMVMLNAESKLTVPEHFTARYRQVELTGEAFFDVRPNKEKPFIVKTEDLKVKVLGTSFNVNAYPKHHHSHVAVASGLVEVSSSNHTKISRLTPSQMGVYDRNEETPQIKKFNPKTIYGWKDMILVFDRDSFNTVTEKLQRWYGVNITISDSTKLTDRFSGEFVNKSLDKVLIGLAYLYDIEYTIKDNEVIIEKIE